MKIILAIFLPPVAALIYGGVGTMLLNILLWVVGSFEFAQK